MWSCAGRHHGPHPAGCNFLNMDGSTRVIRDSVGIVTFQLAQCLVQRDQIVRTGLRRGEILGELHAPPAESAITPCTSTPSFLSAQCPGGPERFRSVRSDLYYRA